MQTIPCIVIFLLSKTTFKSVKLDYFENNMEKEIIFMKMSKIHFSKMIQCRLHNMKYTKIFSPWNQVDLNFTDIKVN